MLLWVTTGALVLTLGIAVYSLICTLACLTCAVGGMSIDPTFTAWNVTSVWASVFAVSLSLTACCTLADYEAKQLLRAGETVKQAENIEELVATAQAGAVRAEKERWLKLGEKLGWLSGLGEGFDPDCAWDYRGDKPRPIMKLDDLLTDPALADDPERSPIPRNAPAE